MAELSVAESLGPNLANPSQNGATDQVVFSKGKEYRFSFPEQRVQGQFEQWLIRNEVKGIMDVQAIGDQSEDDQIKASFFKEADRQRMVLSSRRSAGNFNWMGDLCRAAWFDVPGRTYLLYLLAYRCDPKITHAEMIDAYVTNRKDMDAAFWWAVGKDLAPVGARNQKGDA